MVSLGEMFRHNLRGIIAQSDAASNAEWELMAGAPRTSVSGLASRTPWLDKWEQYVRQAGGNPAELFQADASAALDEWEIEALAVLSRLDAQTRDRLIGALDAAIPASAAPTDPGERSST